MSTSVLKRRKISKDGISPATQKYKCSYNFVFSDEISDWMFANKTTGIDRKRKYKQRGGKY